MATGLANLLLGANFTQDDPFCTTLINYFKNHWRMSDPCANLTQIQPGMIVSDSDDEKLYHYQAAACFEIIQGDTPISDDLQIIGGDGSDSILIPYEETTNDAVIWGLPVDPKRGLIFCDVADVGGDFTGLVTASTYPQISLVDLDIDSMIQFGFTADDKPTITLRSGVYYSLFQESQAEGLAGADTRLGLDETLRMFLILDRGDINNDKGLGAFANPTIVMYSAAATEKMTLDYKTLMLRDMFTIAVPTTADLTFTSKVDNALGHMFTFNSLANIELTDDNGHQVWMYLESKVKHTLTAAFDALYINLFAGNTYGDGSTGDGNNLLRLADDGVTKFRANLYGYVKAGTLSAVLADNDTFVTTIPDSWTGIIIVENVTDTTSGVYHLDGTALTVINQNAAFTTAQGTNDKINVYIAANLLTVENTWAAAKTVKVFFIGT